MHDILVQLEKKRAAARLGGGQKRSARAILPLNPLATAPFAATDALARLVLGAAQQLRGATPTHVGAAAGMGSAEPPVDLEMPMPPPEVEPGPTDAFPELLVEQLPGDSSGMVDEVAKLRQEIDALKLAMGAAPEAPRSRPRLPARRHPRPK